MLTLRIKLPFHYTEDDIKKEICTVLPIEKDEITATELLRRTLDLKDELNPCYKALVAFSASEEKENGLLKIRNKVQKCENLTLDFKKAEIGFRPVVVGAGPSGLFCALALAKMNLNPIVLERGLPVEERKLKVDFFNKTGILDEDCNIQFGEGGAGTYSDGKLKVGGVDKYKMTVLSEFVEAGADRDIIYSSNAHLGTDRLSKIVANLRKKIISLGGQFIFSAKFRRLELKDKKVQGVYFTKDEKENFIATKAVVLATGHSAHDTLKMLHGVGLPMVSKGFGVGVRIEHPRELINKAVYGKATQIIDYTASYHLVTHLKNGRSVYSFCMCPGGSVVAATGTKGRIVTNGMSEHSRMGDNSNSAILVSVTPSDFESDSPLSGLEFQRKIEEKAYSLTKDYKAPSQRLEDFKNGVNSTHYGDTVPTYPRGVEFVGLNEFLPEYITESISSAIADFDSWLPGFDYGDAMLTGPETRTTSPIRIIRDENYMADGFFGIFPSGEGAGYAGGIVSSATDGIHTAEHLSLIFDNK